MERVPRRRATDRIRELADAAWETGDKETAGELHESARRMEKARIPWTPLERLRRIGHR